MIAWTMLNEAVRTLPPQIVQKVNESDLYVIVGNNSRISIKGADKPDSLRGVGLDGLILDEYADMKPAAFEDVLRPALTDKKGWAIFIGTPKGFNHFYSLYMLAKQDEDWSTFRFTTYDNPMIDPAEIDAAKKNIPDDKFAQEYMAEFKKREGLVYPEFNRDQHIFTKLPEKTWVETIVGVDFGYTVPSAMVIIKKDSDANYWIVDEYYKTGKTNAELIEIAKGYRATYGINQFYPDPAEPDRIVEWGNHGLNCRDVSKDIDAGTDCVRNLFKTGRLHISADCNNTIWELERYAYAEGKEKPIKEDDHICDALRYCLYANAPDSVILEQQDFALYEASYE